MNGKHLFLTSAGLTDKMKEKFFDIIGKCPKDVKVLYIPTAGIETDGARESLAICFHELFLMGIQYENILVYNLELILSKDYQRTYSSYVTTPFMLTRLLTFEELNQFDAVFVSGGDVSVLCREMSRTGFDRILNNAIKNGLIYLEKNLSKNEILELYINNIYYGSGYYSVYSASMGYFNKKPSELTLDEASLLAGIPNAPSIYSLDVNPTLARQRQKQVISAMKEYNYIND